MLNYLHGKLPSAAPKEAKRYRQVGTVMAGLLFIERIGASIYNTSEPDSQNPYDRIFGLKTIKALYDISKEDYCV